jgi:hypothetical protein
MVIYDMSDCPARASTPADTLNGRRGGHLSDKQLGEVINWLIADLKAINQLRRDELQRLNRLRAGVYRDAREAGLAPSVLRALAGLTRNS